LIFSDDDAHDRAIFAINNNTPVGRRRGISWALASLPCRILGEHLVGDRFPVQLSAANNDVDNINIRGQSLLSSLVVGSF